MQQSNVGFFSKIKENYSTKFSNLSITGRDSEKDGSTDDSTLLHNSLVKYYDSKGLPYPEWLGVKVMNQARTHQAQSQAQGQFNFQSNPHSQFQPVHHNNSYNNNYSQQHSQSQLHSNPQNQHMYVERTPSPNETSSFRSSSRLQDMYNKSRQQSLSGSSHSLPAQQQYQQQQQQQQKPQPGRSNSYVSTSGSRLRERMIQSSTSMNAVHQISPNSTGTRPSWK
ncbi:hypothetical protein JA1_002034 [Spathaspora sp. JA1]|nr:hypothetical protein JA1_002034 [Spathaspora sp. JA1]